MRSISTTVDHEPTPAPARPGRAGKVVARVLLTLVVALASGLAAARFTSSPAQFGPHRA
jgi:hypothetical protein